MRDCVCKIVCQFFGMGSVYFSVCLFLGWWLLELGFFLVVWGYVLCWVCLFVGW